MQTYIGSYDQTRTVIQVQDNPDFRLSKTVQFTFMNSIYDFSTADVYLSCQDEQEGVKKCLNKLEMARNMSSWTSFIERRFYKNGNVVQAFQTLSSSRLAKLDYNAAINISKTQVCINISGWTTNKETIQVRLYLLAGFPKFTLSGHSQILEIKGQISYPISFDIQPYCMNLQLDDDQLKIYELIKESDNISGLFHFMGLQSSIEKITFADEQKYINYLGLISGISVVIALIWFSIALAKELR
ncbi:Hypothetical_protein [Hexamita inflata]|nr:Hypothetical protein HINF_LOCUS56438 [Hexamita inflata]